MFWHIQCESKSSEQHKQPWNIQSIIEYVDGQNRGQELTKEF